MVSTPSATSSRTSTDDYLGGVSTGHGTPDSVRRTRTIGLDDIADLLLKLKPAFVCFMRDCEGQMKHKVNIDRTTQRMSDTTYQNRRPKDLLCDWETIVQILRCYRPDDQVQGLKKGNRSTRRARLLHRAHSTTHY